MARMKKMEKAGNITKSSELRYRRLFETAQDGILLTDFNTGMILDANKFLINLLGYSKADFLKRHLWEIGVFKKIAASKKNFLTLQKKKYARFEDLPLETKAGKQINVEFVANAYQVEDKTIIQCNIRDITDRKKLEESLQESEGNFRAIFEGINDGLLLADRVTQKFYTGNNKICQMLGYNLKEIKKLGVADIHPKESLPYVLEQFKKQMKREIEVSENLPVKRKDGSVFYSDINSSLISLAGKTYLMGVFRDVTERKKTEEALAFSDIILRTQLESSIDGILVVDEKGKILSFNQRFVSMWSIPPDVIESKSDERALQSVMGKLANPEEFLRKVEHLYEARSEISRDDIILKDGRTFDRYSAPMLGAGGKYYGRVWYFRDITDQKQTVKNLENAKTAALNILEDLRAEKEALAKMEAEGKALLESIGAGVIATDKKGIIIVMNRAAETLLGYKRKELLDKKLDDVIRIEDEQGNRIPSEEQPIQIALAEGRATAINAYFYEVRDGVKLPVALTVAPVILDKNIIGAINVFSDITKERELERMRMDFLSLASHQLRTPLSGTKWLIETMHKGILGTLTKRQKDYLDDIYKINERMIKLVSDILSTLRLESEVGLVKKEKISVPSSLEDVLIAVTAAAKEMKVVLQNQLINHRILTIETNLETLRSILEIILSNAINYSMPGQKVILGAKEESGAVVFFVRDFGIGIPEEEQNRIFERFYRASNAKNLKPSGTGLGLNIARILAGKIGAKISFESEANKGSTFYLRIPKGSSESVKARSGKSKN